MLKSSQNTKYAIISEFIGSGLLVIASISPMILFVDVFNTSVALAVIADAIAVGFILFSLIEIFGPISGAHFNPAVSLVMLRLKKMNAKEAIMYVITQISGGITGLVFTHMMYFHEKPVLISVSQNVRTGGNYISEIIGTFVLVLAILLLIETQSQKTSLVIGMLVGGELLATSSTMFSNPQITLARAFTYSAAGVRLFDAGIFIFMQIIGSLVAVYVYSKIYSEIGS